MFISMTVMACDPTCSHRASTDLLPRLPATVRIKSGKCRSVRLLVVPPDQFGVRVGSSDPERAVIGQELNNLSTQSFRALGASEHVCAALQQRGITAPFPIQELVLPDALAGRDVLAKSPTGSGKTLAFAIPRADRLARDARPPAGLVLVPTRELAMQV